MADEQRILQAGAFVILNADPTRARAIAAGCGIELLPGEDLIAAMARAKGVTRDCMEAYFRALAADIPVSEAHVLAAPAIGKVQ